MFLTLLMACAKNPALPPPRMQLGDDGLRAELVTNGALEERLATPDNADWVLFYAGEQRGDLAPCGCPSRPRGGLPRSASIVNSSDPSMFVNAGGWLDAGQGLDGNPIPEAALKNLWMLRGLTKMRPAAVHVGFEDLVGLSSLESPPLTLPMVSANLRGPGIEPVVFAEHRGLRFAFTGVSHRGHSSIQTPDYERLPPHAAANAVLSSLPTDVDVVILFSHGATDAAKRLAKSGRIDAVIDTQDHRSFDAPFRVGDAIWINSHTQGLRLGEFRMGSNGGLDRKIDLDDTLPDDPSLRAIADEAAAEIEGLRVRLFGP